MKTGVARVMISVNSVNSVNGAKGGSGSQYLTTIVRDYAQDLLTESGMIAGKATVMQANIVQYNRFNPHLDYKVFIVPALMVMLLTMLCGFLPACRACLWTYAGGQFTDNLPLCNHLCPYCISVGAGYIQLLQHDAAGTVCYRVFHRDFNPDERAVFSGKQYAARRTGCHAVQSFAAFYGSDAGSLSQRKQYVGTDAAILRPVRFCGGFRWLGGDQL